MTEPAQVVERLGEELLRALPGFRARRRRRRVVVASLVGAIVVAGTTAVVTRLGDDSPQPVVVMEGDGEDVQASTTAPAAPTPSTPTPSATLGPDPVWQEAATSLRVSDAPELFWTDSEVLVVESFNWGEQVIGERWDPETNIAVPMAPSGLSWRHDPAVAWTGTELLVVGGSSGEGFLRDGRAYDPVADRWRALADAPPASDEPARVGGPAVWTGTELVLWASGLAYDPVLDRWRSIAPTPLSERRGVVVVWTGTEIIVWGGCDQVRTPSCDEENVDLLADGASYDPRLDTWTSLPETPLTPAVHAVAVWNGQDVIVAVTDPGADSAEGRTAAYSPAARTWRILTDPALSSRRHSAVVWTGTRVVMWGGDGGAADGAAYDPATDTWAGLPASPGPGRALHSMVSAGGRIYISATQQAPQPLVLNVPASDVDGKGTETTAPTPALSLPELAVAAAPFDVVVPISATDDLSLTMRIAPSLLPGSEGNDLCLILTGAGGGAATSCQSAALVGQVHHLAADWGGTGWQPSLGSRVVVAVASAGVASIRVTSAASPSDVTVASLTPFEIPGVGWLGTAVLAIDPAWGGPVQVVGLDASGRPLQPPSPPNGSGAVRGALRDGRSFVVWDEPGRGLCVTVANGYLGCENDGSDDGPHPTSARTAANQLAYGILPGSAARVEILLADGTRVDEGLIVGGADGTIWAVPLPPDEEPVEAIFTADDGTVVERQPLL